MANELLNERIQNLIDAASFKEPKKIPVGGSFYGWPFGYAGVQYTDLMDEPQKAVAAYMKCFDDIPMDYTYIYGIAEPVKAFKVLGNDSYDFNRDGTYVHNPQENQEYMGTWIYDDIIDDPHKFLYDTYLKLKCPKLNTSKEEAYKLFREALKEYKKYLEFNGLISHELVNKRQMPNLMDDTSGVSNYSPLTVIFTGARGIRNTLVDLRRIPDKVHAACDAIYEEQMKSFDHDPSDFTAPWPWGFSCYHPEGFVSPKEYEQIYFKYFKKTMLPFLEKGMKCFLMGEGAFLNTVERFRELPKGSMIIQIDADDPFKVHEKVGDWCTLMTGITVDRLALSSKQECVDYVKRCFDTFAPGGGFIFHTNAPLMSIRDGKIENVIAAYETADALSRQ